MTSRLLFKSDPLMPDKFKGELHQVKLSTKSVVHLQTTQHKRKWPHRSSVGVRKLKTNGARELEIDEDNISQLSYLHEQGKGQCFDLSFTSTRKQEKPIGYHRFFHATDPTNGSTLRNNSNASTLRNK